MKNEYPITRSIQGEATRPLPVTLLRRPLWGATCQVKGSALQGMLMRLWQRGRVHPVGPWWQVTDCAEDRASELLSSSALPTRQARPSFQRLLFSSSMSLLRERLLSGVPGESAVMLLLPRSVLSPLRCSWKREWEWFRISFTQVGLWGGYGKPILVFHGLRTSPVSPALLPWVK